MTEEVAEVLQTDRGILQVAQALNEAEDRRNAAIVPGEFADLNDVDEELDQFILPEEEVKIKERVWVEANEDYLEAIAGELGIVTHHKLSFEPSLFGDNNLFEHHDEGARMS